MTIPAEGLLSVRSARGKWTLAATIMASAIVFMDATVVSVALPPIQRDFSAAYSGLQWVSNAYLVALTAFLLLGGSFGDIFGRRKGFVLGLVGFGIGSLAAGLALSLEALIVGRAIQGLGGALLVPGSLAIITASFDPAERGRAIGWWAAFSGIGAALGPFFGGALIDAFSWEWVFLANVPLLGIALAVTLPFVPDSRDESAPRHLDTAGGVLAVVALAALTYGLIEGPNRGWTDGVIVGSLAAGALAFAAFLAVEARVRAPMLPLGIFRSASFTGANLATLAIYAGLNGLFFYAVLNMQQVQGLSPLAAGAGVIPITGLLLVGSGYAGKIADRYGPRGPMTAGPLIAAAGTFLALRAGEGASYWTTLLPAFLVFGVGLTLTVAPLTTAVLSSVEASHAGVASGINNAVARFAALLAFAVLPALSLASFSAALERDLPSLPVPAEQRADILARANEQGGLAPPPGLDADAARAVEDLVDRAFLGGYRVAIGVSAALIALGGLVSWVTIRIAPAAKRAEEEAPCAPPTVCAPGRAPAPAPGAAV